MSERGRSPAPPGEGGSSQARQSSRGSTSRSGSPSRASVSGTSVAGAPATGWKTGPGFDPAKPAAKEQRGNTRMELPPDAYVTEARKDTFALRGNKLNTQGKLDAIEVNQLRMTKFDFSKTIYQYDVVISPDVDKKRVVMKKIWAHASLKNALAKYNYPMWIFDGTSLAWAPGVVDRGEVRCTVDLDEGQRRPNTPQNSNKFLVTIRKTTEVKVSNLQGYLDRKMQFNDSVQEALNFIDHLIRQRPSEHLLAIKRNFYKQSQRGIPLMDGAVVEVHKGTYASVRLSHNLAQGGIGLALNADVTNTCFWTGRQYMSQLMLNFFATCDRNWRGLTPLRATTLLKPVRGQNGLWQSSEAFKQLRKLRKLKFTVKHPNRPASTKVYTVMDFVFDQKYGQEGANARNVTFDYKGKQISVYDYFRSKYNAVCNNADYPLIDAGKGGFIPLEYAFVEPMQRYAYKLNPDQTAAMIKIAVTRPAVRKADIQKNIADLQISSDPYLKYYGVQFESNFAKTEARILAPPIVNFGQGSADPKFSGRWDLRGKKLWKANKAPLENWGFIVMDGCVNLPQLQQFAKTFRTTFIGHGGKCPADAVLINTDELKDKKKDIATCVKYAHEKITQQRGYTQLLFVVVGQRNSPHYERLKKSTDCRFGILSQVVNGPAVVNNNGQYHSNVCLKVNAKLGGATSRTLPPWKSSSTYFPKDRPTMMVGVDVSHAAPGGVSPSTAAMTMSIDRDATRYAAIVESNGYRTEMLTSRNVHFMFGQLVKQWQGEHAGDFPKHIMYFRDGVAEGQFAQVIDQEIGEIRNFFHQAAPKLPAPKFTVIVATKRHHIRFFPQKGDKNGNALPGTLVEKEVTHPFMWDFYLCSHVAIQGTARPVHYHVILDEMNVPVNDLQKMIYHQCYSYARSTTPVSLHPAVYYAHLAGNRGRAHENIATSEGFRHGAKGHEMIRDKEAKGKSLGPPPPGSDAPPLLPLGGKLEEGPGGPVAGEERQRNFFRGTMWYI